MAKIHDLLEKVADPRLKEALTAEVDKLSKQKKFGLVFEEHLPEACPMPGVKIRVGMSVATREQDGGSIFRVKAIEGDKAICVDESTEVDIVLSLDDIVAVTKFGEPIYPYLEKIDEVDHGGGDLWHTLIQADNYHALQLLEYLYPGQVDCIYIDPPYNTGAKDWKYNNDYVDGNDAWRHSKWLSMMEKRLKIAKRLLNPRDSVLIVTIDEKEYLHLGMLLEQMFPEARIQMVSIIMNHAGTGRKTDFARVNEFAFYVQFGESVILPEYEYGEGHVSVLWDVLRRSELSNTRDKTKTQFYPIFINDLTGRIDSVGEPLANGVMISSVFPPMNCTAVFPIRDDGIETMWSCKREELLRRISSGYIRVGKKDVTKPQQYSLSYIKTGAISDIENGRAKVEGYGPDGSVKAFYIGKKKKNPPSVIEDAAYDARIHGSGMLFNVLGEDRFSFPKSLYAVRDSLKFVIANKPNALILDFFAGSGTTLHAVNLLNAEDGGKRRCILVTNNEVSNDAAKAFREKGLKPGDAEWEAKGIARYVTWPRTTCSIKGVNVKGEPLKGEYLNAKGGALGDRALPMAEGFKANAAFFKLGFLEPSPVALGRKFGEMLPLLWLKAGAHGACPNAKKLEGMLVLPENKMAVLADEWELAAFKKQVKAAKTIETIYLVTDYEPSFRSMAKAFPGKTVIALYRDYLDHFRLNISRN